MKEGREWGELGNRERERESERSTRRDRDDYDVVGDIVL